jgi:alpha-L-fucosidase
MFWMKNFKARASVSAIAFVVLGACANQVTSDVAEPMDLVEFPTAQRWVVDESDRQRTDWYTDARFGMFIHWGLYSEAAGEWKGDRYYGITEWLMRRARETTPEYSKLAAQFNPVEYDADYWVSVAKASGMKYIVITAKHHDGFALFDSEVSDFDIVDATPFKRDALKELTDAAAKEGIRVGFYYSQFQDWTDPNAGGNTWEYDEENKDFSVYLNQKAKPQVQELLTNYGDVGLIWFDTPGDITKEDAQALSDWVRTHQPDTLISSRLGHDLGDFTTLADAQLPATPITDRAWEGIFTHNDSWGYSGFDNNFKSTSDLLQKLATVASKNGNLLLNVGPDGDGNLPDGSVSRFKNVGDWLAINGESIYGTKGSPIGPVPWGAVTHRPGTLYLHVFNPPESGEILLPYVTENVTRVGFLETRESLDWNQDGQSVTIRLPTELPDSRSSVIRLDYDGLIEDNGWNVPTIVSSEYDTTELSPKWAILDGDAEPAMDRFYLYFGDWKYYDWISGLKTPSDSATWSVRVLQPGEYRVTLSYAADETSVGKEGFIGTEESTIAFQVVQTMDKESGIASNRPLAVLDHHVGLISFAEAGNYNLVLKPRQSGENLFRLTKVTLEPVD